MSTRGHLAFLVIATAAWAAFWVIGLPDYYRSWPTWALAVASALLLVPFFAGGWLYLRRPRRTSRMRRAAILAFYCTVPPFLFDYAYCGLHLGHGLGFVVPYWYLTIYYVIPWVMYLPMARWLDRSAPGAPAAAGDAGA